MLDEASILLDGSDQVVQANPAAYRLGLVEDDALVSGQVLEAVRQVRSQGGRRRFDLVTDTPKRFIPEPSADVQPVLGQGTDRKAVVQASGRPNWLKVTVGRISGEFILILLDDVSDAVRFSQVRDAFIDNVSEQLVKPSKDLERLADSLEHGHLDAQQIADDARQVRASCTHLSHMVADLILLIKAQEPVKPSQENRISVKDQLDAVAASLAAISQRLEVRLVVQSDPSLTINADTDQIQAAVGKLAENALAYSPKGSSVTLSAAPSRDGSQALIRVVDRGSGIAKAEQSHVFERFYRGKEQSGRNEDGVGLGLAIVKHVALTHHGSVGLWSAPGQGSTFTLALPVAR
ncbi:ATPase [Bifidobacterium aemilianum]|uniref:Sensor-like histidine kinase SenX3 n=2 Tax=Bifidobacterium aemilianum TaxID=2493120 RepID=A0A366K7W6_9BIFI|nr:ATPase [Bifidobacterium aemilianum]